MRKPERMCACCRQKSEKEVMIRIVKNKNGEIFIDKTYKADGRGVYICKQKECLAKAVKSKALNRAFKTEIKSELYEELIKSL